MNVAVLKLGGSLLDLGDLPDRLRAVLALLDGDWPLLICGGGVAADVVRGWHDSHGLSEEQSHWLAMDSIRLNQRLLLTLMPELELVSNRVAAESAWRRGRVPLLDLMSFVSIEETALAGDATLPRVHNNNSTGRGQAPQNSKLAEPSVGDTQDLAPPILNFAVPDPGQMLFCTPLPHSWEVTSDSLAGWVAIRWPANRLVLLKSVGLPVAADRVSFREAADSGHVDAYFPSLGARLPSTSWCDLRRGGAIELCSFGR